MGNPGDNRGNPAGESWFTGLPLDTEEGVCLGAKKVRKGHIRRLRIRLYETLGAHLSASGEARPEAGS